MTFRNVQRSEFRDSKCLNTMHSSIWGSLYCQVVVFVEISRKEDIAVLLSGLFRPRDSEDEDNTRKKRETEELKDCALVDDEARECVPYYLCKKESVEQVGFCPAYLDTCCLTSSF